MAKRLVSKKPNVRVAVVAVTTAAFLSGAMASLAAITIPVFLEAGPESIDGLLRLWARLYHYGHLCMPAICISATTLFAYCAWTKREAKINQWHNYAAAGVTTLAMVPFTLTVMNPTNNALFELVESTVGLSVKLGDVRSLVVKWAWLHAARSIFPLAGAALGFRTILQEYQPVKM